MFDSYGLRRTLERGGYTVEKPNLIQRLFMPISEFERYVSRDGKLTAVTRQKGFGKKPNVIMNMNNTDPQLRILSTLKESGHVGCVVDWARGGSYTPVNDFLPPMGYARIES
jgi:hypothetical protein